MLPSFHRSFLGGKTALTAAILLGNVAVVQVLLHHGADLSRHVVIRDGAFLGFWGSTDVRIRAADQALGLVFRKGDGTVYLDCGEHLSIEVGGSISTDREN